MGDANSQPNNKNAITDFVKTYQFSIGLSLVLLGVADLWFVMPNMYAGIMGNWHTEGQFFYYHMPEWFFTIPILLILTLIGALMLSLYSVRGIREGSVGNKQNAAILATALGFTYQVIGAWPLWNQLYPWQWQTEIAQYGNWLVFNLFIGSLFCINTRSRLVVPPQ